MMRIVTVVTPEPLGPPYLVVLLKPGWRYDASSRQFVSSRGKGLPVEGLPQGSRVVPMIPALADVPPSTLSPDERRLARYVHVLLPDGEDPAEFLSAIRRQPYIADAQLPPAVSLP